MVKKTGPGYEGYLQTNSALRQARRPELVAGWDTLPGGFRALLAKNAGVTVPRGKGALFDLSAADRQKLLTANHRLAALAVTAAQILSGSLRLDR